MSTTDAGRVGEAKVLAILTVQGWYPFVDVSGKCPVDVVAWKDGKTITIQVKSTASKSSSGKYIAQIGAVRPNRSGNVIKKFDPDAQDYLAVYVEPEDKVYFIKSEDVKSGRALTIQEHMESSTLAC